MMSKPLTAAVIVGGCLAVAAGGGYLAGRHNAPAMPPASAASPEAAPAQEPRPLPVSETEAVIEGSEDAFPVVEPAVPPAPPPAAVPPSRRDLPVRRGPVRNARNDTPPPAADDAPVESVPVPEALPEWEAVPPIAAAPIPERAAAPAEPAARYEEVVIPAAAVIGLQVETPISSDRNRVEDRVEARVTRDVMAEGRVAIPAGSRVLGNVTVVERGGKVKERARLGVRFHTVVLAGGLQVPLRTETILREGESPSGESARKIGGAAAGGAILGAILGGGKGAAIGGAAGAGAGTAAVMAGDRNAATLPAGTTVTARLAAPVVIEVEKR